jgi:hypothetical protein
VLLWGLLGLGAAAAGMASLPRAYRVTRQATFSHSAERVFRVVSRFDKAMRWRPYVSSVELLPVDAEGRPGFTERTSRGPITHRVVRLEPPHALELHAVHDRRRCTWCWSWRLEALEDGHTRVTVEERADLAEPWLRLWARVMGRAAHIELLLRALGNYLGQPAEVTPAEPLASTASQIGTEQVSDLVE